MKLTSLAVIASMALAAHLQAQTTPAQSQPSTPAAATSDGSLGKACKKEVKDLCGRAHGQEMQECIKSGMDMNKFSADCKAKLAAKAGKPSS